MDVQLEYNEEELLAMTPLAKDFISRKDGSFRRDDSGFTTEYSGPSTEDCTLSKEDSDLSEDGAFSKEDSGSLDDGGEEYQQMSRKEFEVSSTASEESPKNHKVQLRQGDPVQRTV